MAVGTSTSRPAQIETDVPCLKGKDDEEASAVSTEDEDSSMKQQSSDGHHRQSSFIPTRLTLRKLAGELHAKNVMKRYREYTTPPPSPESLAAHPAEPATMPHKIIHGFHSSSTASKDSTSTGDAKHRQTSSLPAIAAAALRAASESLQAGFSSEASSEKSMEFAMQRADEEREEDISQRVKESCQEEMEAYIARVGGAEFASLADYWDDCVNGGSDRAGRANPFTSGSTSALQDRWKAAFCFAWRDAGGQIADASDEMLVQTSTTATSIDSDDVSDPENDDSDGRFERQVSGVTGSSWGGIVRIWTSKFQTENRATDNDTRQEGDPDAVWV